MSQEADSVSGRRFGESESFRKRSRCVLMAVGSRYVQLKTSTASSDLTAFKQTREDSFLCRFAPHHGCLPAR